MRYPKDISIIIPTYNREKDLKITLENGLPFIDKVREVLIIDQSTNNETKKLIFALKNKKIRYYRRKIPSLTAARNFGVSKISKNSKIVLFLDDDVTLDKEYLNGLLDVFNSYANAMGVSGFQIREGRGRMERFLRGIFFLENSGNNNADVKSVYGAVYPFILNKVINSHWLTGYNMAYRREVFLDLKFDENLSKYALAEDFDFSYRINKKYPSSLFVTPYAKVVHRFSSEERTPTEKAAYMNQINHFYLNYKNFNSNFKEKIIFLWALIGITLLRTLDLSIKRNKNSFLKLKFYLQSLFYCLRNLDKIKRGQLNQLVL